MTITLPISKRGGLTLPPALRRKLGLDGIENPLVIVEEREIPRATLARWISRDEAEMSAFTR